MKYNTVNEIPNSEIGNFVILGGMGIMDGLKSTPCKHSAHKIVNITDEGMTVRSYRRRVNQILPRHNFGQEAMTYTPAEVKQFPEYSFEV